MAVSMKWNVAFMIWTFSDLKPSGVSVKRGKACGSVTLCPPGQAFASEAWRVFGHSTSFKRVLGALWSGVCASGIVIRYLVITVPPADWGAACSRSSLTALVTPVRRQAFIFFLHCSPQAQLGLGSSDTTMDLRALSLLLKLVVSRIENIYLNLAKSFIDTMFSWKFFLPFITKLWGAFSRWLCWHFLLFVVNLLLVLNSCQYRILYVLYSLLVLCYSLFIDIYTSVSMFNDGTCPAKQVWVSQSHLKQRGWKEVRILNFFRGSGDRLSSIIKCWIFSFFFFIYFY